MYITLTQGKKAIIDDSDYDIVKGYTWHVYKSTSGKYYASTNRSRKLGKYQIKMHRLILGLDKGDGLIADHINGDTLDNRRCNLRITTVRGNNMNKRQQSNGSTPYKGVHKHSQYNKHVAQIKSGNTRVHIGVFDTPEKAALAYNEHAIKLHGEYAWLNEV